MPSPTGAATLILSLLVVGIPPAARATDPAAEWTAGSTWEGIVTANSPFVKKGTGTVSIKVTKRDGKTFEGRYTSAGGKVVKEIKGTVDDNGFVEFKFTKVVKNTLNDEERRKNASGMKNIVGIRVLGSVVGKRYEGKYTHPFADNPALDPRVATLNLTLKPPTGTPKTGR